jgi:hypothetical protein
MGIRAPHCCSFWCVQGVTEVVPIDINKRLRRLLDLLAVFRGTAESLIALLGTRSRVLGWQLWRWPNKNGYWKENEEQMILQVPVGQAVDRCIGLTPPASELAARVPQIYVHSNYTISGFMRSVHFYASRALWPVWL